MRETNMLDEEVTLLKALSQTPRVVCGEAIETARRLEKMGFVRLDEEEAGERACAITDQGVAALAAVSLG